MNDSELTYPYSQALDAVTGIDEWSRVRAASLNAFAAEIPELNDAGARDSLLVHLVDPGSADHSVPAAQAGEMLERLQRAVARLAKARRTSSADVKRVFQDDIDRARLDVLAASPGSLVVEIQSHHQVAVTAGDEQTVIPGGDTFVAELALRELIRALPESAEDEAALDAIAVADPVVRRAVGDLVLRRKGELLDVGFRLELTDDEPVESHLSPVQVKALRRTLNIASEDRTVEVRRGRLDGVRSRRRIFYLVSGGSEIHGLVDEELLPTVKAKLDQMVDVRLEVIVSRTKAGRASHRRYRLLGFGSDQDELVDLTSGDEGFRSSR